MPQAVASSYPVAGRFATVPQSRKILDLATINPVCRESLVAASCCHLRSSWWLLCLHSAKLENFGRATVNRCRRSACQLILDDKSAQLPIPTRWVHNPREKKTKKTTRQARRPPRPRRRLLLAPLPRSSLAPSGRPVAPLAQGARKFLWAQIVVARCPGNGRLGVLPEKRKMMAGPGNQPPIRPARKKYLFFSVRSEKGRHPPTRPGLLMASRRFSGKLENLKIRRCSRV